MDTRNITGSVRTVCIVAYPGAEILDITGPMETFAFANLMLQQHGLITEPAYQIEVLAEKPGPLLTSCGLRIIADRAYSEVTDGIDTLLIAGAPDVNAILCDPMLADWVRTVSPRRKAVCSTDAAPPVTGAFAGAWPRITHRYGSSRIIFSFGTAKSLRRAASPPASTWRWLWWMRIGGARLPWPSHNIWWSSSNGPAGSPSSARISRRRRAAVPIYGTCKHGSWGILRKTCELRFLQIAWI